MDVARLREMLDQKLMERQARENVLDISLTVCIAHMKCIPPNDLI